jgi:hypothetical protein
LKLDKKKKSKDEKMLQSSNSQEEVTQIFDVAKKIVSIFNKIRIVEFLFDIVVSSKIMINSRSNAVIRNEILSFCKELEEQFYSVMEKLIQFYAFKVSEKNVTSKDAVFLVPSVETCALLNILGRE